MEIPQALKQLYKHWPEHSIEKPKNAEGQVEYNQPLMESIEAFIHERINIWEQKEQNQPKPWTQDPVLSKYRFCNIFREFDKQTITFHTLLKPLTTDFPLWLMNMFYCRLVANPNTISKTGLLNFSHADNIKLKYCLQNLPRPKYGTPYVFPVSTILKSKYPTRELLLTEYLPKNIKPLAETISQFRKEPVAKALGRVISKFNFNLSFLWTEVLIDTAYQYPNLLDLFEEFPVGPGAKPTLARINSAVPPSILVQKLATQRKQTGVTFGGTPVTLSAENWEGIACEFRKYSNLQIGKGRKRIYR